MKAIIATLLFISAAGAIQNVAGLPEARSSRLHLLLKDGPINAEKLTNLYNSKTTAHMASLLEKLPLNDHGESSGSGAGSGDGGSGSGGSGSESGGSASGMGPDPLETLAESLRYIGPALKSLKEAKDHSGEENAEEFLDALKENKDDDEVKGLLGRHVITQHIHCDDIKERFSKYVHESVIYGLLGHDALDLQEDMAGVFEAAEMYPEVDIFEAFSYLVHQRGLHDHPGIKAILMIGGIVADAACDEKLDGLFKMIGEKVEEYDPHGKFDLASRINLDLYAEKDTVCKRGLAKRLEPPGGIKDRILDLLFAGHSAINCHEVNFFRFIVDTIIEGIKLDEKYELLHAIAKGHEHTLIKQVTDLMENGREDLAHNIIGGYLLRNLRGALTVGLAVEKRLEPKPTGSKPTGSKPNGSKPAGSKPNGSKPKGSKPGGRKPRGVKPRGPKF